MISFIPINATFWLSSMITVAVFDLELVLLKI